MLESATRLYIPWPGWKRGWGWSACWQYQWGCSRASPTSTGWPTFPSGRGGWGSGALWTPSLPPFWAQSRYLSASSLARRYSAPPLATTIGVAHQGAPGRRTRWPGEGTSPPVAPGPAGSSWPASTCSRGRRMSATSRERLWTGFRYWDQSRSWAFLVPMIGPGHFWSWCLVPVPVPFKFWSQFWSRSCSLAIEIFI